MSLSTTSTNTILRSLKLRSERDPLRYFKPASGEQLVALQCKSKGSLVLGGNRAGKTFTGAAETCWRATATHPYKRTRRCRRIWCISQELPGGSDKPHTQLEAIRRWMPLAALRGGSWGRAYSPAARVLTLASGCKLEFKSYDQDLLSFESAAVDWIWFDEEPTRREIYNSCLLRLVDRRGAWMMTLTPVLSLEGKGWVEDLWEGRAETQDYECFQLFTTRNVHLPQEELESVTRSLTAEERAVRLEGAFARLGGRVLAEFSADVHLCDDFLPPREWRHYLVIDPGWHTAAHLWAAVDTQGDVWLYDEVYAHERTPAEIVPVLHRLWQAQCPAITVLMDPAGFPPKRTSTGHEAPSDAQEYHAAAEACGAAWLYAQPADNADPYAWRVKRYLQARRLHICRGLRWWRWEQERWTRQREREGPAALERAVPDKPIDRYNHLQDCLRYLVNTLPDPIPAEPDTHRDVYQEYWQRERTRLDEAAQERPPMV